MKAITVGDPHAKISTLQDLEKVIDFAIFSKKDETAIILLGDLFNDHGVVRNEISYFWRDQLQKLSKVFEKVIILVGNHDQVGSLEKEHVHSLWAFKDYESTFVVDKPTVIDGALFLPYTAKEELFVEWANSSPEKLVFCHQTFDGATYDNGMYAPDGFSLEKLKDKQIVSGHIHSQSEFGNVWYPGTALWESASDANKTKGIWRIEFDTTGIISKEMISTAGIVPEMVSVEIKEEQDEIPDLLEGKKYTFHLIGTSAWSSKLKKKLSGHKVKITFTDSMVRKSQKKESAATIHDFVRGKNLDNAEAVLSYIGGL